MPTAQEQVRFLEAAVNHLDDAVIVTEAGLIDSPGPRIVYANPACAAMTGYELGEIIGRSPRLFQGPRTERAALERIREALRRREPVRTELTNYTKNGVEFRVELDIVPLRDAAGTVTHFLAVQRDVSAPRRAEQILSRARLAAEHASRGKTEILAMASQEIRAPVNALLGFADLLFDSRLAPDQRDYVETIRACGDDLLRLSNELLDLAKIEAGRLELAAVPFEPLALLQSVLGGFEVEIDRRRLDLALQVEPQVPTHVVGDPTRLRQILHAALGVLLRSVDRGKISLGIGRAPLEEADASHPLPSVPRSGASPGSGLGSGRFRLVYRLSETDTAVRGDGDILALSGSGSNPEKGPRATGSLDLTVARRLAQLMGGGVETKAEPGLGSSFSFWIVVSECPVPDASPASGAAFSVPVSFSAPEATAPASPASDDSLAILVVEDNPVNQKLLLALLKRLGYKGDLAGHGGEALDRLRERAYDIVFMDVQMPVMDGFQATRRIRAGEAGGDRAEVPVVAVTAGAMRGDREKCIQAGMNEYLSKPISAPALQAVLDKVKEAKRKGRTVAS